MQHWLAILSAAAMLALTDDARSQVMPGMFGHTVTGQNGTAGEFCFAFDCTPRALAVVAGETLTLQVNAPYQNFFAIGASFAATSCTQIPGLANRLILDAPIVTLALGSIGQSSPILACWGGYQQVQLALPGWLPTGLAFTTQAVAAVPNLTANTPYSLSVAVRLTVQ